MDPIDSLKRLQDLQADLIAFSEARLPNVERLWAELENSIDDFSQLLDRKHKNDVSRQAIDKEKIAIDGVEYSINREFREEVVQIADELDLDEVEAARLLLSVNDDIQEEDTSGTINAITKFHTRREALLNALRLTIQQTQNLDCDSDQRAVFTQCVQLTVQNNGGKTVQSPSYWRRCLQEMENIQSWIKRLGDRVASILVIGETQKSTTLEVLEYQRASLVRQHESAAIVLCILIKLGHTTVGDYEMMMQKLANLDSLDELVVHYMPSLITFPAQFGPSDGSASTEEARSIDKSFSESKPWALPEFRAAATVWWLSEYSERFIDGHEGSEEHDSEKEKEVRSEKVMNALRDGALHCILLTCSTSRSQLWHDPAKTGLISFLLGSFGTTHPGALILSHHFDFLLCESLQVFIGALISNMPDTIRRLKFEEDEQRRNNLGISQPANIQQDSTLHLERFMTVISFAFQISSDSAMDAFWDDVDGNMYGFLHWASKRQSTPRAAAFCEMFQSIADDEACAEAAHRFLHDEHQNTTSIKLRRGTSLCWSQIFAELQFYADQLKENPKLLNYHSESALTLQAAEPESTLMLECYLRLTTHMCRTSTAARELILGHPEFRLHEVLFNICQSDTEPRFRACAYNTLSSMLHQKSVETSYGLWDATDAWLCGTSGPKSSYTKSPTGSFSPDSVMDGRFKKIVSGFEEPNAFVRFLQHLIELPQDQQPLHDALPFPEQLGVSYRMPSIDQYIDFVMSSVMIGVLPLLENQSQIWELRCACLDFIRICLTSFNEDLVVFANITNIRIDAAINTSSLVNYVRLHPFARVMEWMFNDGIVAQLFAAAHVDPTLVATFPADSPLVTSVARAVQVIDLIMSLQATYLDLVRLVVKTQAVTRPRQVANPTLAYFEDAVLPNINIVVDLVAYCSTGFEHLTILSLKLLHRFAQSRKLAVSSPSSRDGRVQPSRLIAALQQTGDLESISLAFVGPIKYDEREFELGYEAPGYGMKTAILNLLDSSLSSAITHNRPVLAHCLLGFLCTDKGIAVIPESPFAKGVSLFHAIVRLYVDTASAEENLLPPWISEIRSTASRILRSLIKSQLTSNVIMAELRDSGFNTLLALMQHPLRLVNADGDMVDLGSRENLLLIKNDLEERTTFFQHQALELQSAISNRTFGLQTRLRSSMLGLTTLETGEQVQNASIFDLFDFTDLPMPNHTDFENRTQFMQGLDFDLCKVGVDDRRTTSSYDMKLVQEMLLLHEAELQKAGQLNDEQRFVQFHAEIDEVIYILALRNHVTDVRLTQRNALQAWTQLILVNISDVTLDESHKTAFITQALQIILPKINVEVAVETTMVLALMKLIDNLIRALFSGSIPQIPEDRILAILRSALGCIIASTDDAEIRECSYKILIRLLNYINNQSPKESTTLVRNARKTIEVHIDRLVDVTTEDALSSSSPLARIPALLFLTTLVDLFCIASSATKTNTKSPIIILIQTFTRLNFPSALLDTIRSIPMIFSSSTSLSSSELDMLVRYTTSTTTLLARLATADARGSSAILEAGLFSAIRDSGLLSTDPDIDPNSNKVELEAMIRFYQLLSGILKIIVSVILQKGNRQDSATKTVRELLTNGEARGLVVGVLKVARRDWLGDHQQNNDSSGLGTEDRDRRRMSDIIEEVMDFIQVLLWSTGFLEHDDKQALGKRRDGIFS